MKAPSHWQKLINIRPYAKVAYDVVHIRNQSQTAKTTQVNLLPSFTIMNAQQIANISFATVIEDTRFAHAKYLDLDIIIRKDGEYQGWTNATQLCRKFNNKKGNPKEYSSWKANKSSQAYIAYFEAKYNLASCDMYIQANDITAGTYAHPNIMLKVAIWCSPKFFDDLVGIFNHYNSEMWRLEKERILADKDTQVLDLTTKLNQVTIGGLAAASTSVVRQKAWGTENIIVVFDLQNGEDDHYYIMRAQRRVIDWRLEKMLPTYPRMIEIDRCENNHAVNTWAAVKEQMVKDGKINARYNNVELLTINQADLLLAIKSVEAENARKFNLTQPANATNAIEQDGIGGE